MEEGTLRAEAAAHAKIRVRMKCLRSEGRQMGLE